MVMIMIIMMITNQKKSQLFKTKLIIIKMIIKKINQYISMKTKNNLINKFLIKEIIKLKKNVNSNN